MNAWFKPTAENFFGRIGKPDILAGDQGSHWQTRRTRHREAQENRTRYLCRTRGKDTTWLPKLLRSSSDKAAKKPLKKPA